MMMFQYRFPVFLQNGAYQEVEVIATNPKAAYLILAGNPAYKKIYNAPLSTKIVNESDYAPKAPEIPKPASFTASNSTSYFERTPSNAFTTTTAGNAESSTYGGSSEPNAAEWVIAIAFCIFFALLGPASSLFRMVFDHENGIENKEFNLPEPAPKYTLVEDTASKIDFIGVSKIYKVLNDLPVLTEKGYDKGFYEFAYNGEVLSRGSIFEVADKFVDREGRVALRVIVFVPEIEAPLLVT